MWSFYQSSKAKWLKCSVNKSGFTEGRTGKIQTISHISHLITNPHCTYQNVSVFAIAAQNYWVVEDRDVACAIIAFF